ncbi:hypothetical protein PBI_KRATIO_95 [Mycobacterium phage Kratio]|uniref:Uncharacterized protein n=2 Tax=Kratiovirus TaxID=2948788 RepID=A0A385DXI0_9CAUD|nr:hypothetical protein PBI_KRATIO_95 [Mycobacterium phage Kratio]YP_009950709.1 hypothetical protein I5G72_gp08 [Mycobacterium phage Collard]AJK27424.1 hypothetical protein PBI_KRATIO_95 [Mycobacterium phage Kratio]AXQ63265.1 hypothetical protein SEA_COLLARD_91 [Mycobacterium phage Collard]UEM46484.1 hypothetical protein SEA_INVICTUSMANEO_90 [Mycobacterium phage InvictusManeo]
MNSKPVRKVRVNNGTAVHVGRFDRYENKVVATLCSNAVFTTENGWQTRRTFRPAGGTVTCGRCKKAQAKLDRD